VGEPATGSSHKKNQNGEGDAGEDHRDANAKLRPLELFLARQWRSRDYCTAKQNNNSSIITKREVSGFPTLK
jgi:hypothetical protein